MNVDLQNELVPAREDVIPRFTGAPIADNESDNRFNTDVGNPVDEEESPLQPDGTYVTVVDGYRRHYDSRKVIGEEKWTPVIGQHHKCIPGQAASLAAVLK